MLRRAALRVLCVLGAVGPTGAVFGACVPGTGPALLPDEAGAGSLGLDDDAGRVRLDASAGDPFAIEGLLPSHGPFTGGTRARIDGRGFSSRLEVFVGGRAVDPASLLASDPTRAAIVVPPGAPGFADVRIRDRETAAERTLVNGWFYDAIVVAPDSGATTGGTRIAVTGSGTAWTAGTSVTVGGAACTDVVVSSPTRVDCLTPVGTPGSKDVVVSPSAGDAVQARDAFTYSDSEDGYRGGLSGGAFAGRMKVLAFDGALGKPLEGAYAIAGTKVARTGASGVVELAELPGEKATVTVAARCFSPITFADVPVDTVTVYLQPVLDPTCLEGDPPPTIPGGGGGRYGGIVSGEIVFPTVREFERAVFTSVPAPNRPTERRAAYVFEAARSPSGAFELPPPSSAITPDTPGTTGFDYALVVYPGNVTLYVVAGLEDRSVEPPSFVPYSMGVARGISVPSQGRASGVDIKLDVLFDHRVTLAAVPPLPGAAGPDRFSASIAVTLGASAYAILPRGSRVVPLPAPDEIPFIGVPALDRALSGEQYVLGGTAATGPNLTLPASVVARVRTANANTPVALGGFLGVPRPVEPGASVWSGTHVEIADAIGPVDMSLTSVVSGPVTWTIVAPGGTTSFDLPDLAALPGAELVSLRRGPIKTTVYTARIDDFSYARFRYGYLSAGAWSAYAANAAVGVY